MGAPLPACSACVLGWGWEGEERRLHAGPGAGCCCLGEGASLTSSRAAISHAVRTLNLKGPCVPASERASGLLFLMHTVKGKKITVIHLLRACRFQNFSFKLSEKRDHLCRASTSWPLPTGPLCRATLGPWRRQLQSTVQPGHLCPALWLLGVPRA